MTASERTQIADLSDRVDKGFAELNRHNSQQDIRLALIEREITGNGSGVGITDRIRNLEKRPRAKALMIKDIVLVAIPVLTLASKMVGIW